MQNYATFKVPRGLHNNILLYKGVIAKLKILIYWKISYVILIGNIPDININVTNVKIIETTS